jgi:Resolvase, N terminal domain
MASPMKRRSKTPPGQFKLSLYREPPLPFDEVGKTNCWTFWRIYCSRPSAEGQPQAKANRRRPMNPKITSEHLHRGALVYVRQSTFGQVMEHTESKRRQYALADAARELGFSSVSIIDDDLGRSGSGLIQRPGFQKLVATVCGGSVGSVFCIEASRLARNGRDISFESPFVNFEQFTTARLSKLPELSNFRSFPSTVGGGYLQLSSLRCLFSM